MEQFSKKHDFIFAENTTHLTDNSCKIAFTLAEVLITLAVIGVVSAITMPMLITNVRNHVRAKRIENIEQKFSKATDKMVALGVYTGLGSTENFVNELGKHLKLAKVCYNDNLQSCWPYEKVITRKSGSTWDIANTKLATDLKMTDDNYSTWDKTMGIITADGTSMILSYNTKCDIDETKPINYGGSISSTTGCVAVVYDWNGVTKPNKYGDDVLSINAKGLHNSCGAIELGNELCLSAPFTPTPITRAECESMIGTTYGIKGCNFQNDYWAGAVKQCGGVNKIPTRAQLTKLAEEMYLTTSGAKPVIGAEDIVSSGLIFQTNNPTAKSLGLTPVFYLWSGEEGDSGHAYLRYFEPSKSVWFIDYRLNSGRRVVCLGD